MADRFARDERGGITMFVLLVFLFVLAVSGIGVDLMRHEMARADLQNALDRGVLAATNKTQSFSNDIATANAEAEELIADFMASRNYAKQNREIDLEDGSRGFDTGFSTNLTLDVTVTPITGGRAIVASAGYPMNTFFMRFVGVDTLSVAAASGARQAATKLEVALVVDVSGSMRRDGVDGTQKIAQLRDAAEDFIIDVLDVTGTFDPDTESGLTANAESTLISFVPFSAQVNLGADLFQNYIPSVRREHNFSSCVKYSSLSSLFNTRAVSLNPTIPYLQSQHFVSNGAGRFQCPGTEAEVIAFENDPNRLVAAIRGLRTEHLTAMFMGMKWGAAFLDPSSRSIVNAKVAAGTLDNEFSNWPNDWSDVDTLKVVVLMSDGRNTRLEEVDEPGYTTLGGADHFNGLTRDQTTDTGFVTTVVDSTLGDTRLQAVCSLLTNPDTNANTVVYTIGFELEEGNTDHEAAADELEDCATDVSTFYRVEGEELATAFETIAAEINLLKLTN